MIRTISIYFLILCEAWSQNIPPSNPPSYPTSWWEIISRENVPSWEILPQDALPGEVILSKRTPLGVFSNLAPATFVWDEQTYASIEGLWQMMKYPDENDPSDPRLNWKNDYPYTRSQVMLLSDFVAKSAGDSANKLMKDHNINWVSYKGKKFNYKDLSVGSDYHYQIIYQATVEKIKQNPKISVLLQETKGLVLKPDHAQAANSPASYYYFDILMKIRDQN